MVAGWYGSGLDKLWLGAIGPTPVYPNQWIHITDGWLIRARFMVLGDLAWCGGDLANKMMGMLLDVMVERRMAK